MIHDNYVCVPTLCTGSTANFNNIVVSGDLTVHGSCTILNTTVCTTSAMSITNQGTGPALVVNQTGSQPVVSLLDDGNSVFYIEDGGDVGIGTTNPLANLHIYGSDEQSLFIGSSNANRALFVLDGASNGDGAGGDYAYLAHNADGSFDIKNLQNNSINFATGSSGTTRMSITSGGNVGIGTTSPAEKFEIQQNGNYQLKLTNGSTGGGNVRIAYADNAFGSGGSKVVFDLDNGGSANAEFVIQSDGNVGIGTTSPKAPLHVGTGSAGNYMGGKTFTLSNTFADALSIELPDHTACYIKLFVNGDWSGHSSVAFVGEYFIQNGADSYNEPGLIISETDNTYNGTVTSQIVDSTTDTFVIQIKLSTTGSFTANLSYQVMGSITSIS